MNIEKIFDILDCFAKQTGLKKEDNFILKNLICGLTYKYSKEFEYVTDEEDDYNKYIIKSVDGKYLLEDFLLNRLMRNLWNVTYDDSITDYTYDIDNLTLNINEKMIEKAIKKIPNADSLTKELTRQKIKIQYFETILQTRVINGKITAWKFKKYKDIIDEIDRYKEGKYHDLLNDFEKIIAKNSKDDDEYVISTGLYYYDEEEGINTYRTVKGLIDVNQILVESEAIDLVNIDKIQTYKVFKGTNNYYQIRDEESEFKDILNYAYLIRILLGNETTFKGLFINPSKLFATFCERYNDIFEEEYGSKSANAWELLLKSIRKIRENDLEEDHLKLANALALCLERKIEYNLDGTNNIELKKELNTFEEDCLWNDDPLKRQELNYVRIFDRIGKKIIMTDGRTDRITLKSISKVIFDSSIKVKEYNEMTDVLNSASKALTQAKQEELAKEIKEIKAPKHAKIDKEEVQAAKEEEVEEEKVVTKESKKAVKDILAKKTKEERAEEKKKEKMKKELEKEVKKSKKLEEKSKKSAKKDAKKA